MIILIGGEKGGSGKSCLAQNIAVCLQKKKRDILLVDADPQGTTSDWVKDRNNNLSVSNIISVQASGNIRNNLISLGKKYQDIIIDAGGQDSEALRSSMTVTTHMLIPLRPKRRDLKTLPTVFKLIELTKTINPELKAMAVITQCPPLPSQASRILDAKNICNSFEISPLNTIIYTRNVYDDVDENGLTVLEANDEKAISEISSLVKEFLGV